MSIASTTPAARFGKTALSILLAVSVGHLLNDTMQSLLASLYPIFKANYALDFVQIGLLTLTFQATASLLQPVVGVVTDHRPLPFSLPIGMGSTFFGLIFLGSARSFPLLLLASGLIGLGSAVFHPEASRVARLASGGRHGLAQSLFQVGGNVGTAIGPLLAAFVVLPLGQHSVAWLSTIALSAAVLLSWVGRWYAMHNRESVGRPPVSRALPLPRRTIVLTLAILVLLTLTKNIYLASVSTYFTFYVMDRFSMGTQEAQLMLFLFLSASALGTLIGGPIGDRFGARFVMWFFDPWRYPPRIAAPLCGPLLDLRTECLDRPYLCIGISRHRGVCAAAGARQGRHDRRPVLWPGFRRGWPRRSPARHRGGCAGNYLCILVVLLPAIARVVHLAAAPHCQPT
jgi:MFS transporter, FSR family, fosmidomycin resistance protein